MTPEGRKKLAAIKEEIRTASREIGFALDDEGNVLVRRQAEPETPHRVTHNADEIDTMKGAATRTRILLTLRFPPRMFSLRAPPGFLSCAPSAHGFHTSCARRRVISAMNYGRARELRLTLKLRKPMRFGAAVRDALVAGAESITIETAGK